MHPITGYRPSRGVICTLPPSHPWTAAAGQAGISGYAVTGRTKKCASWTPVVKSTVSAWTWTFCQCGYRRSELWAGEEANDAHPLERNPSCALKPIFRAAEHRDVASGRLSLVQGREERVAEQFCYDTERRHENDFSRC